MRNLVLIAPILSLACGGCAKPTRSGDLNQAVADYEKGRYSQAQDAATQAIKVGHGASKDDAAYVAGLSAYQLGDEDEAERRWSAAAASSNPQTAARAKAMLGQLRLEQKRPREAAQLLADAAANLEGEDARQAASRAAIAYQQAGDAATSKRYLAMSGGTTSASVKPSPAAGTKPAGSLPFPSNGYALQVGAFNDLKRARRAADDAEKLGKKEGLGPVKVFSKHDDRGRAFFIVHLGNFTTRDEAASARARLGKLEFVVAPAAGKSS